MENLNKISVSLGESLEKPERGQPLTRDIVIKSVGYEHFLSHVKDCPLMFPPLETLA